MRLTSPAFLPGTIRIAANALDSVPKKYYTQPKAKLIYGTHKLQAGESNSESTFSHKLVAAIERDFEQANFHIDKQYETEISKQIIFRNEEKRETYGPTFNRLYDSGNGESEEFYTKPDIVIHAGQDDFKKQNQIFIAELKTAPNLSQSLFNIDLFKIAVYHDDLLFNHSAFFIINVTEEDVRTMYNAYCSNGYYLSERPGAYIIVKNGYDSLVKVYRIN
jgi:hypothetical protein